MENISNHSVKSLSSDEINQIEEFRKSKHTAVLAVLFSDIVNSTLGTEKLGEQTYSKLRHIHDELFKRIMCHDKAGIIIKEIGDSFLCVFAEPSTAVLRAIEFQSAIDSNKENLTVDNYTLSVKIGIHVGQVAVENSLALDIFGRHVNRAARIQAIANGGQILTSQAIWENATGWLKDNNEKSIEWISYGKTKLKGIDERVDVYGFYTKEMGKGATPIIFKKQKQNRRIFILITFLFFSMLIFSIVKKFNQLKQDTQSTALFKSNQSYFVQFDFSELFNQETMNKSNQIIDTIALQEKLLSQIITVFNPDSVVTESDLIRLFSNNGTFYVRHENTSSLDSRYFRDTLKFAGSIFIHAKKNVDGLRDSIKLHIRMDMYPDHESSNASEKEEWFHLMNIETNFRNLIQDMIMSTSTNMWTIQGYVLNCNDSVLFFRKTKEANLRPGAALKFMREYIEKEGLKRRLEDIENEISYFKNFANDSIKVNTLSHEFTRVENEISTSHSIGRGSIGIDLKGKVIELYDLTGKATWQVSGNYLIEKPRAGDVVYLAY